MGCALPFICPLPRNRVSELGNSGFMGMMKGQQAFFGSEEALASGRILLFFSFFYPKTE